MIVPGLRERLGERGLMLPDASAAVLDAYVRERVALFGPPLLTAADLRPLLGAGGLAAPKGPGCPRWPQVPQKCGRAWRATHHRGSLASAGL